MRFKVDYYFKGIIYWEIFITACQLKIFVLIPHNFILENKINNKTLL